MQSVTWHSLEAPEVLQQLESSPSGLKSEEVRQRVSRFGPNSIPPKKQRSILLLLLSQFSDFMIIVLLAAALISGLVGEPEDAIAILVIVLLNAIVGSVQELRAERAIAALRKLAALEARVFRDGHTATVDATDLVPGDLVMLQAGNVVPADMRLLEAQEMQTDESALTGESSAVSKQIGAIGNTDLPPADQLNMVFKGSLVTNGTATGVVVATGAGTEMGRIAQLLQGEAGVRTPLQQRLTRFGRYLALSVLAICAIVFVAGLLQGQAVMLMFLTAVSLAVAAIPEALPAVITVSLALGARKLTRQNALIRNLPAVETLGSVTCICADKTGTLTQNRMTTELFFYAGQRQSTPGKPGAEATAAEFGIAMALCNDIIREDDKPVGEPTELALYQAAQDSGFSKEDLITRYSRLAAIPFDSERKLMTTLHQGQDGVVAYVKGAPEKLLPLCQSENGQQATTTFSPDQLMAEASTLANEGYRVLAFARSPSVREDSCSPLSVALESSAIPRRLAIATAVPG